MKRFIVSVISGIMFPVAYTFFAAGICWMFPEYGLDTMYLYGEPTPGIILVPVGIPFYIDEFIRFHRFFGLRFIFDTVWFRATWLIGFNIIFYTAITYLLLHHFQIFKKKTAKFSNPPMPPEF